MAIRVKETLFGRVLSVAVVAATLMGGVQAHAASLKEALEQKQVVIGIQGDNPPWGFIDSTGQQQGFDADVAKAFVKSLGVEAKFVPLAIANRIPALTTGKVDVLFSTLVMNAERAKAIQYSVPYAGNDNALVAPKDRPIKSMDDLAGLKVGCRARRWWTPRPRKWRPPEPRSFASTTTPPTSRRSCRARSMRSAATSSMSAAWTTPVPVPSRRN